MDNLINYIPQILDALKVKYTLHNNRISGCCPVHEGDNPTALTIYLKSKFNYVGNWICWTNHCEEIYGKDVIGLVSGILDVNKTQALKWIRENISTDFKNVNYYKRNNDINDVLNIELPKPLNINRKDVRSKLKIPAPYYLARGYSQTILDKYDVGLCIDKRKPMYMRSVVPVYDEQYKKIYGCLGRNINPQCPKCKKYHEKNRPCPSNELEELWATKWRNSRGFSSGSTLFNYWFAKSHINKSGICILVEGIGDVLRLEEADIHIGLGLFSDKITQNQKFLLERLGIKTIILALDNDKAGEKAQKKVAETLYRTYNIQQVTLPKKDIGEMQVEEVKNVFGFIYR